VAAVGRRGAGGVVSIRGAGFLATAFRPRTSRAGDPQLHTHVLIANLLQGVDGRWSAIDGRAIFQHAKTAGYVYEARLRARLTERLGVEWTPVRNGIADGGSLFRRRMTGSQNVGGLVVAGGLLALMALGEHVSAMVLSALVAGLLAVLLARDRTPHL
jgi:hypothetical protein